MFYVKASYYVLEVPLSEIVARVAYILPYLLFEKVV